MSARAFLGALAVSLGLAWGVSRASAADKPEPPSLSEKASEAFHNLQALIDAKNYTAILTLLNGLIPAVDPNSYDRMMIEDTLAKVYWSALENPGEAIVHFERVLEITKVHPEYMPEKDRIDHLQWTAQAYYMKAAALKGDPKTQAELFEKSMGFFKQWLDVAKKPRGEDLYLYAMLLYQKASANPEKIDLPVMRQARKATEQALLIDIKPKDTYYQLLAIECEQEGDLITASDYLELLTQMKPTTKTYWEQLMTIYNNIAGTMEKDPKQQRVYYAREINAIERAQALGFLKTGKTNFLLVQLYTSVGQFGRGTELLYQGLKSGAIDNTEQNWILLAEFHRQVGRTFEAINTLKEAEKLYSHSGEIDRLIGEIYYQDYNTAQAFRYYKQAIAKDHFTQQKPYAVYQVYAFIAYEMQKYPEALEAVQAALKMPGSPKKELRNFEDGIQQAIKQQEANKTASQPAGSDQPAPPAAPAKTTD